MRSFMFAASACVLLIVMTGCPTDPVCGDYVCESTEREGGSFACPLDCQDDGPDPSGYCDAPASASGAALDMWLMQQWCDQWCWSAVITNVANYYGKTADGYGPVQECQLASYRLGDPSLSVCCQYAACSYQACNSPGSFQQMSQIMTALGLTGRLEARPLTEAEIQVELTNGRPIIMAIQSQTSGHVALLTGYARQGGQATYRVDDPWPYNMWGVPSSGNAGTRYFMSYQQLRYGSTTGQSLWVATYTRLSPRADGCSPPVNPSCACGSGPGPQPSCGDGICSDQESYEGSCPSDCPIDVCGDGICQSGEAASCPDDCQTSTCTNPSYPVDCMDGTGCWPSSVDCSLTAYPCGAQYWRCNDASGTMSCCGGTPVFCPGTHPYYCPADGLCYQSPPNCGGSCTILSASCD